MGGVIQWRCPECGRAMKLREEYFGSGKFRCACNKFTLNSWDEATSSPVGKSGRQAAKPQIDRPESGPGRELEKLIGELNLPSLGCGACKELAKQMDLWGPDGCREHREHIVRDIRSRADKVGWLDYFKAAASSAAGAANDVLHLRKPWFNPLDPIGSMVDEAIRRARECDPPAAAPPQN